MKEYILGIIGTITGIVSLIVQCVKGYKVKQKEKKEKERESQETLSLIICNQIEYYEGIYRIKIINTSLASSAYNLNVSFRIKNRHFNYTYKIPNFSAQETIYSINKELDKASCEIYMRINVLDIEEKEFAKNASIEILKLYKEGKLGLKDLLENRENYLAVRYYAVNSATGGIIEFPKHVFDYNDIVHGRFGIGNDYVTPLEEWKV